MKKLKRNDSIIQVEKFCILTDLEINELDPHEPIGGKNKQQSMLDGLWVWVTRERHRWLHDTEEGQKKNNELKIIMQEAWMGLRYPHNHEQAVEEFIKVYGKNYLRGD